MTRTSPLKALLATLLLATPAAQAVLIDFEDFGATDFQHGTVVTNQYDSAAYGNLTISADNYRFANPSVNDRAVVFDSNTLASQTTDDDLVAPFENATRGDSSPGNILIIQENSTDCGTGICSDPDDEGRQPAGKINFAFKQAIEVLSIDYFDIENTGPGDENNNQAGSELRFFDSSDTEIFGGNFAPGTGNNGWDRLSFAGVTGVYRIEVNLIGSGAIDNLVYSVVPVPAAFWLFGTALIGFIGFSRRTSI